MNSNTIYTIGHSNHTIEYFTDLLKRHGINAVADVRSAPYSKYHSQFNKETLSLYLNNEGISYVFLGKELGARPDDPGCYKNGKVNYDLLAERDEFKKGLNRIIDGSKKRQIALMCAEKEPLDCHRTILICHRLRDFGLSIKHILSDGTIEDHSTAELRLLELTKTEENLFNYTQSASKLLEQAYEKRAQEIAYLAEDREVYHGK